MATPIEPISTMRRTAAGRAAARDRATAPPIELPMMSTGPVPSVSSSARACSVQGARVDDRGGHARDVDLAGRQGGRGHDVLPVLTGSGLAGSLLAGPGLA